MRILLACLTLLAGCDTTPKRVDVPVAVPCITTVPPAPTIYSNAELLAMSEGQYADAIFLDRRTLIRAVAARDAAIRACAVLK